MRYHVAAELHTTKGCCGVTQIVDFSDEDAEDEDVSGTGSTQEEAWADLFKNLTSHDPHAQWGCGRVMQIWFYRPKNWEGVFADEYKAEPFRKLIETIPGVIDLGEHLNPNSGNMIQGYQWEYKPDE